MPGTDQSVSGIYCILVNMLIGEGAAMIQKLKAYLNTQTITKSLISAALGVVIFLLSQVLLTILVQKEFADIPALKNIHYGIHFAAGLISLFIMKQSSKGEGIAKAAISAILYGALISGISIVLFDAIGVRVIAIILVFFAGGLICSFIKNALQGGRKTKRRRSINW